jgi:hypothetical protein
MARNIPPVEGTSGAGEGAGALEGSLVDAGPARPGRVLGAVESGMIDKIGYRPSVAIAEVLDAFL